MKSVKEITSTISKLSKLVIECEKQGNDLTNQAKDLYNSWRGTDSIFANRDEDPEYIKYNELKDQAAAAYIKAGETKKIITVWQFNLLHAKKAELLPAWVEVMRAYEGKKIGAVREKEIREKLHAVGITGYFSKYAYSCPKICLSFLDSRGCCSSPDYVNLSGNYQIDFFDENGNFKMPDLSTFKFYGEGTPYIENPKSYIKNLEKLAARAKKAAAEYNKELHAYNAAAVPGFAQIETYNKEPASIAEYFKITK